MEEHNSDINKKIKVREGSGYLRQLYSTARNTASTNHNHLKNLTTFLVNFVPVDKVDASELQVRRHFDDQELLNLSESIKKHGVFQPILVVQNGDRYKVIAGERRLRASKLAGLERIPARIISTDDKSTHEVALRENLDRVDLHPIEEGDAYLSLLEAQAYTSHEGIAKGFGKPKSRITECIGYTKLPEETKREVMRRNLKQRAVLRKLLAAPPEEHLGIIDSYSNVDFESALPDAGGGGTEQTPETSDTAESDISTAAPKEKRKAEFQYFLDSKGVRISSFRWKVGEGKDPLQDYVNKVKSLLEQIETTFLT